MVDINALRGISSPEKDKPLEKKDKKQKIREEKIEQGLNSARPDMQGYDKDRAKEILLQKTQNNEKIPDDMEDLAFQVAQSLQTIENETTPVNEYFYWIEDAQDVIKNMNDGDITDGDIAAREDFLDMLTVRETEMRVYMDLYRASKSPMAKERLALLELKLAKLQQLRSAIQASTKSKEEAEYERRVSEEEKRLALEYYRMLEEQKQREDQTLFDVVDLDYQMSLRAAQTMIALAALDENAKLYQLRQQRFQNFMSNRADNLKYLAKFESQQALHDRYAKHLETANLVKVANSAQNVGNFNEDDKVRRDVCGAVLEYRLRGKEVPEKVLYKLGVKSFVPEYSMSEEILNKSFENQTTEERIKRINELRGRQNTSSVPQLVNRNKIQSFDLGRFNALQKRNVNVMD